MNAREAAAALNAKGGTAYPCKLADREPGYTEVETFPGMTLRDAFAMAAIQGAVTQGWSRAGLERMAGDAYALADAMLAERAK